METQAARPRGEIRNRVPGMKYRPLGKTGIVLSEIGLGAHYDAPGWQKKSAKTPGRRREIVRKAFELGINFYDVCKEEERETLGEALEPYRGRVFTMTDINALKQERKATADDYRQEFLRNIKTLRMSSVDLLRFNNNNQKDPITFEQTELAYRVFQELRDAGKARHFAVSGHWPDQMLKCIERYDFIEAFYLPFNYATQEAAAELFPAAKQKGVGVIVIKPFMMGSLFQLPEDDPKLKGLRRRERETIALANLKFILANAAVTTAIPGVQTLEELTANVQAIGRGEATQAELEVLNCAARYAVEHPYPGYEWLAQRWCARA